MTIRVALEHRTAYTFDRPVQVYPHTVRLRPAPHARTPITAYSLTVEPAGHFINWQQDPFGNYLARIVFPELVEKLVITVDVVAEMTVINPFDFFVEDYAETFPFDYPAILKRDLEPYLHPVDEDDANPTGPGPVVQQWIKDNLHVPDEGMRIVDFLVMVNSAINRDIAYTVRLETGVQTPDHTLGARLGSCRDSAWLLVSVLRQFGLAARFVSGYLIQLASDVKPVDGPSGPEADFTDLHAWAEVYVPGAGWIGLDATSGLFAGEGHIPLSCTPHPSSAAPIEGATGITNVEFEFSNTVTRVHEDVRVTLPYSDQQWAQVQALGQYVDDRLVEGDVRLTMGGEPTFVSADDSSTPQWEFAADGPEKRELATKLADRLAARWSKDGVVHHGQGKWYPGEPLPRWAITMTWRKDGGPLWHNPALLDSPWGEPVVEPGSVQSQLEARNLAFGIARRLGVPIDVVQPAYEDPIATMWDEVRRPTGERPGQDLDPDDPSIADAAARQATVDAGDTNPGDPVGWAIPVFPNPDGEGWGTTRWRTRRRHLFLTVGTSAMGYRLPLNSLAWTEGPDTPERSTYAEVGQLPEFDPASDPVDAPPATMHDIEDAPRFALTVQERDGHYFVFLPPLSELEDATTLLAAIEGAAHTVGKPVVLEGYPLPRDPRTDTLSVTPDPGVIEVNVQPTQTWAELVELTTTLYEDARQEHLATEKFDVDGTHTGTGGGNHFTLGAATPAQSPLLRRPDLLRSMITYWQHHPALSYVFSGRFIGPTSQAPRVDEGRHETLYELEIAFAELERVTAEAAERAAAEGKEDPRDATAPPWLVDRLLRHLLTDLTGNTHRSEFCIDKLYSPDSATGRLGLLEMRGFEMPPHPQMALVQMLLVRGLVAKFWAEPYAGPLVRWGSRLHDRFLLPAFAAADLRAVVADLNRFFAETHTGDSPPPQFEESWLEPFLNFRFPRLGECDIDGIHLELHQAVEPWNVLGEEMSSGGTARYVDSSVERVQVAATGMVEGRHVITCNGVPVPMVRAAGAGFGSSTGAGSSTFVGGVRFRAWAPPSALHPTIGVHGPLVFDVVDTWNGRSIGGFTHHVVHPGGRSYDTYPVNAVEAESRRASRFQVQGHTAGRIDMSTWPSPVVLGETEMPTTLDLRRFDPGVKPGTGAPAPDDAAAPPDDAQPSDGDRQPTPEQAPDQQLGIEEDDAEAGGVPQAQRPAPVEQQQLGDSTPGATGDEASAAGASTGSDTAGDDTTGSDVAGDDTAGDVAGGQAAGSEG